MTEFEDELEASAELVAIGGAAGPVNVNGLAEALTASAAERGVQLTGANGLLTALTARCCKRRSRPR